MYSLSSYMKLNRLTCQGIQVEITMNWTQVLGPKPEVAQEKTLNTLVLHFKYLWTKEKG